jgi:hypothetical protein
VPDRARSREAGKQSDESLIRVAICCACCCNGAQGRREFLKCPASGSLSAAALTNANTTLAPTPLCGIRREAGLCSLFPRGNGLPQ